MKIRHRRNKPPKPIEKSKTEEKTSPNNHDNDKSDNSNPKESSKRSKHSDRSDRHYRSRRSRSRSRNRHYSRRSRHGSRRYSRERSRSRNRSRRYSRERSRSRNRSRRDDQSRNRSPSLSFSSSSSYSDSSSDSSDTKKKTTKNNLFKSILEKPINSKLKTPVFPLEAHNLSIQDKIQHQAMITANPCLTRLARRVYVGNLPTTIGLTEAILLEYFDILLKYVGINTPQPLLSVWLSDPPAFCFLELRSVSDTTKCLTLLENFQLSGKTLKVNRPPDYQIPEPNLQNFVVGAMPIDFDSKLKVVDPAAHKIRQRADVHGTKRDGRRFKVAFPIFSGTRTPHELIPVKIKPSIDGGISVAPAFDEDKAAVLAQNPLDKKPSEFFVGLPEELRAILIGSLPKDVAANQSISDIDVLPSRPCPPSLIVVVENMVRPEELIKEDDYKDIIFDIREGAERYGEVAQVVVPRPGYAPADFGVGKVFIEYLSVKSSMNARRFMPRRKFLGREISVKYYEEYKYKAYIF